MENERSTVERIVRLISYLACKEGDVGIKEVADELCLPQSTTHRLIHQLIGLGIMQRVHGARRYEFGPEMYRLGAMINHKINIVQLATPALHRIVAHTNESCVLALYRDDDASLVFAASVESPQQLRYQLDLYKPVSVLWGASGHSVLAHLPPERIKQLLKQEPISPTGLSPLPTPELNKELKLIRERGYAVSKRGEKIDGAAGVSAAIFAAENRLVGCFSLFIPRMRYPESREDDLARLVVREARLLSEALSGKKVTAST